MGGDTKLQSTNSWRLKKWTSKNKISDEKSEKK